MVYFQTGGRGFIGRDGWPFCVRGPRALVCASPQPVSQVLHVESITECGWGFSLAVWYSRDPHLEEAGGYRVNAFLWHSKIRKEVNWIGGSVRLW